MGANKTGNPINADSAEVLWQDTTKFIRLIQWIDDNGDIVHDSSLGFTLGGGTVVMVVQPLNDALGCGGVVYQAGPFNPGIPASYFEITDMDEGHMLVWLT